MAKKAYIGVDSKARKVKKGYVGVLTDVPIYEEAVVTVEINHDNVTDMFDVVYGEYSFEPYKNNNRTWYSNNKYQSNSTASTTLTAKYDMSVSFTYSYSSEANYDKFTLKVAGTTVENAVSGSTQVKNYSGSLKAGQSIEFTYAKDGSQDKYNDECSFSDMTVVANAKTQVGFETKSLARQIKKAYIGIGGVARPCWSGGELAYYGTISSLNYGTQDLAATSTGNYALFAGGITEKGTLRNSVTAYTSSLVRSSPAALSESRQQLSAASVGNYALFVGGSLLTEPSKVVDYYDTSLTHSRTAITYATKWMAATSVGNYALFGGGYLSTASTKILYAFDASLTMTRLADESNALRTKVSTLAATSVGGYALFAGGSTADLFEPTSACVDAYNSSLTRSAAPDLSVERYDLSGASVGDYAVFAGGENGRGDVFATTDAYDKSLTKVSVDSIGTARFGSGATTVEGFAIFAGGEINTGAKTTAVDVYDSSLTRTEGTSLSKARYEMGATTIGNYALFGGGDVGSGVDTSVVDAFVVA